jgi:hypothetical protein
MEDWYYESPALQSLSPATKKRMHGELEKEIDEITTGSEVMYGPEGKTPSELDAIIAEYHRNIKENLMLFMQLRQRMEGTELTDVFATCIDVCHCTACQEGAVAHCTPQRGDLHPEVPPWP